MGERRHGFRAGIVPGTGAAEGRAEDAILMRTPYAIEGPAVLAFSGEGTSTYLLEHAPTRAGQAPRERHPDP